MTRALLIAVWVATLTATTQGHGRLVDPPTRGTAWRMAFNTPKNYNDHETNCGGFQMQHETFKGKCGVCGDPFGGPRLSEPGPRNVYATGTIVRTYYQGQTINADVEVTASHKGYYEFKLCQNDVRQAGRNRSIAVEQACFDRVLLKSPDGESRFREGAKNISLTLPDDVLCKACVLQWRWKTGNSWGCDNGTCGLGIGDQEEFWACADIAVVPKISSGAANSSEISDGAATGSNSSRAPLSSSRGRLVAVNNRASASLTTSLSGMTTARTRKPVSFAKSNGRFTTARSRAAISTSTSTSRFTTPLAQPSSTAATGSFRTTSAPRIRSTPNTGRLACRGEQPWGSMHDGWCDVNCNHVPPYCPPSHCKCFATGSTA